MQRVVPMVLVLSVVHVVTAGKTEPRTYHIEGANLTELEELMDKYGIPFTTEGNSRLGIVGKAGEFLKIIQLILQKYKFTWPEFMKDVNVLFREINAKLKRNKQDTTTMLLFTKLGTDYEPQALISKKVSKQILKSSSFNPAWPTLIMVHGWLTSSIRKDSWARDIKELILKKRNYNVFYVDWNHLAFDMNFIRVKDSMPIIAQDIYAMLTNLKDAFPEFDMSEIHLMGHSLGSHIVGLVGQKMGGNVKQLTGVDPAGPLLQKSPKEAILSKGDGKYVLAYHTEILALGTPRRVADRDVFMNGGELQPCCSGFKDGTFRAAGCRHKQALYYPAVYMGKCVMVAYRCPDYKSFLEGQCASCGEDSTSCVTVGHDWQYEDIDESVFIPEGFGDLPAKDKDVTPVASGLVYYVNTGPEIPYCLFHYQVVVTFSGDTVMNVGMPLKLVLRVDNSSAVVVELSRASATRKQIEVTDPSGEQSTKVISGNLKTALLTVDKRSELYSAMPVKFTSAEIAQNSQYIGATIAQVYVNFMSHPDSELRKSYSGPVAISKTRSTSAGRTAKGYSLHQSASNAVGGEAIEAGVQVWFYGCHPGFSSDCNGSPKGGVRGQCDNDSGN